MERLHHLFEEACDRYSERIAIIFQNKRITYRELDELANRLARYLLSLGLGPDDRIGVCLRRSIFTYASLLAISKIHAVFVPLDPDFPQERLAFILKDANVKALVTTSDLFRPLGDLKLVFLDNVETQLEAFPSKRLSPEEVPPAQDNLCYIIYTSGTTGRPKGVMIEHPSIVNFIRIAREIYGIRQDDRVYQGMTIAFDFSVEEIWLPLTSGAAIVPAPPERKLLGSELKEFLLRHKISVLCCVPTLLATLDPPIPCLRLIIVGGEPCPPELVVRWAHPGLRMLNTYGPTETTVTATWCELKPGKPVTIGRPLPTYRVYLLDQNLRPVAPGKVGEICISGPGVARGYLNREDLTREKFVKHPENPHERLYRTGDLGRFNEEGEIEFLGRIDTQVKIRGYRIELSEIESVILSLKEVERAVVSVWKPSAHQAELVAYCLLKKGASEELFRQKLYELWRKKLPSYMIPTYIEILEELPTLPSGKVDRSKLPPPKGPRLALRSKDFVPPKTELEKEIAAAFAQTLNVEEVSVEDDFFEDLGGHSLLAAKLVSLLRKDPRFEGLSLADLYKAPTVRQLARYLEKNWSIEPEKGEQRRKISHIRVWFCGWGQALGLYGYLFLLSLPGLFCLRQAWFGYENGLPFFPQIFRWLTAGVAAEICWSLTLPILIKWLFLRRLRPGRYPLWGWMFWRWWLFQRALALSPIGYLSGTPFLNFYFRLLGARIHLSAKLRSHLLHGPDLIEIGAETTISDSTHLFAYQVRGGWLYFAPVKLGKRCFVGSNSVLLPGTVMEDESFLGPQSLLPTGQHIPKGETWIGSPAQPSRDKDLEELRNFQPDPRSFWNSLAEIIGFALAVPLAMSVPLFCLLPGVFILRQAYLYGGYLYLLATPLAGLSFVMSLCLAAVLTKHLLLPRLREGVYPLHSFFYLRKWFFDRLMRTSLELTDALYATLYLPPFLRLLGAKIGSWTEISTIAHITPDLLVIADDSFIADAAHVGPATIYRDQIRVRRTVIGKRTFVGNSAFVPEGTVLPDDCLLGVLSLPPKDGLRPGTTWLGSPAIFLPRREQSQPFPEHLTFRPTKELYVKRLFYEYFRATLPPTLYFLVFSLIFEALVSLLPKWPLFGVAALIPPMLLLSGIFLLFLVAGLKKLLIGTYHPRVEPLWSIFVRRSELITGLYENVVVPALLNHLLGTPFAALVLRALGAKVGAKCFLETTYLTEFDLVEVGEESEIGPMVSLQTHLFEDRVMKMSRVKVGPRCSIGPRAVVLYDTELEEGVKLEGLTLVMKGEKLPSGSHWCGAPARRWKSKPAFQGPGSRRVCYG